MKKNMHIFLGAAVTAALVLASTPAFASPRSLPADESLYAFGCDGSGEPAVGLVDVATGAVTEVVPRFEGQCFSSPAYNPVDNKIYVIDWTNVNDELAVFDTQAKTLTTIATFDCDPYTLAIDPSGNAWVWDNTTNELRPVSLTTAACGTGVGVVAGGDNFYGMAFAPNGTLYGANYADGELGTISTVDGTFTQVGSSAMVSGDNAGLTFDSSGIAWVADESNNAEIYSADITNYSGTDELSGQLTFNGVEYYSQAIGVGPSAGLAETGIDSVALGVSGLAGLGALAVGAVMIVRRRAS
jgi:hypothetical protein